MTINEKIDYECNKHPPGTLREMLRINMEYIRNTTINGKYEGKTFYLEQYERLRKK